MLTKGNVDFLLKNGVMDITAHTLSAEHAYKVVKFKNILKNLSSEMEKMEEGFRKELQIDDAFITKINTLIKKESPSKKEQEELDKLKEIDNKFGEMRNAMFNEEAGLSEAKTMPYEEWKKLQDENKNTVIVYRNSVGQIVGQKELLIVFESELENILWKAPEE